MMKSTIVCACRKIKKAKGIVTLSLEAVKSSGYNFSPDLSPLFLANPSGH
jgi:hypothetical protein